MGVWRIQSERVAALPAGLKTMKPSRAMIPGELSWAFLSLCYALAGSGIPPFGAGSLYYALNEHASPELWALLLAVPALVLIWAASREWFAHHRCCSGDEGACWLPSQLYHSAKIRGWCCLWSIPGYGYMLKVLVHDLQRASVLAVIAAGGCVFMWWFYVENRRVRREVRKHGGLDRVSA